MHNQQSTLQSSGPTPQPMSESEAPDASVSTTPEARTRQEDVTDMGLGHTEPLWKRIFHMDDARRHAQPENDTRGTNVRTK